MTTPPPNGPSGDSSNQAWERQPSSVDWSDFQNDQVEPDPGPAGSGSTQPYPASGQPGGFQPYAPPGQPQPYGQPQPFGQPGQYPPPQPYGQPSQYQPPQPYQPPGQYPPPPGFSGPPPPGGFGGPGGYPYPVPTRRQTDGFSIASFVLGLIAIFPLGFVFGIVGIVRTKAHQRRGRWMAVLGMILSVAWVIGLVALVAVVSGSRATRSADGTVTKAGKISPWNVKIGDCVKLPSTLGTLLTITVTPCTEPHNAQAFAEAPLTGSSYPGTTEIRAQARTGCSRLAVAFVGSDINPNLHLIYLVPTSQRWNRDNDRTAHCLLLDPDKDITGDIRADK
ncbi:MAG: hypothetical protein M3Y42_07465 [Actinomycetota bacterium]|nr:hypothetical protein [Actinomycetota bacterium]MDQ2956786.1 hypothetical protein [Actinomycetota bacterium]